MGVPLGPLAPARHTPAVVATSKADSHGKWRSALLSASVAGILAAFGVTFNGTAAYAVSEGNVECYGINKCAGAGACGGKGHSCAGKNGCEGQAWLELSEENCLNIKGGRLTAEDEDSES